MKKLTLILMIVSLPAIAQTIRCRDEYSLKHAISDGALELQIQKQSDGHLAASISMLGFAKTVLRTVKIKKIGRKTYRGERFRFVDNGKHGYLAVSLAQPVTIASVKHPRKEIKEKMICK